MDNSNKEFLEQAIHDYNKMFGCNFDISGNDNGFQDYYRDISKRMQGTTEKDAHGNQYEKIDLLIVVGMFLTGFDAKELNTLFVDKNLCYHGLIQAYSRTNRIYNDSKPFGNIVTFRDLQQATYEALALFCGKGAQYVIEKSFEYYMYGELDESAQQSDDQQVQPKKARCFIEVNKALKEQFPYPSAITTESDKIDFVRLFSEYLRLENKLKNYDKFTALQEMQKIDLNNAYDVQTFKDEYQLQDDDYKKMQSINLLEERKLQDYKSTYHDIREWVNNNKQYSTNTKHDFNDVKWNNIEFEHELLAVDEINLDYLIAQIFEKAKNTSNKDDILSSANFVIRSSLAHRNKSEYIIEFIKNNDIKNFDNSEDFVREFFKFAQNAQESEANKIIDEEHLNAVKAKQYFNQSIAKGSADDLGTDLGDILPKISPINPKYTETRNRVLKKIQDLLAKFKDIGGQIN